MSVTTTKIIYNGETKVMEKNLDAAAVFNVYKGKYPALAESGTYSESVEGSVKTITIATAVGKKG